VGRPPRPIGGGITYHAMARGNDRRGIFPSDGDRLDFLHRLGRVSARHGWRCLAYCLMDNHFHLVVTTPTGSLPEGMRDLLGGFARSVNRRNGSTGHLFGDRYREVVVDSDRQLAAVIAYVHNNPVRADLVTTCEEWRWSSCSALLGLEPAPSFLHIDDALSFLSNNEDAAREDLRSLSALRSEDLDVSIAQLPCSRNIVPKAKEPPVRQRPTIAGIFFLSGLTEGIATCVDAGYTQIEIARFLGVTPSAVSQRLRRHDEQPREGKQLAG
jgi:putative transposase